MNRSLRSLLVGAALCGVLPLVATPAHAQLIPPPGSIAQFPNTPPPSPLARVSQQVGVSEVTITWSSPARREREVWGGVVPFGEVWRAGANRPTRVMVTSDFLFGETAVEAGEYSLFIIPTAESLEFILNRDSSGRGAFGHDPADDVARFRTAPAPGPDRERLVYWFDSTTDEETHLTLEWAGWSGRVPIRIDTAALARQAIDANLAQAWRPHYNAGRYYLESGQDLAQAAEWMAMSIHIQETWANHWFMARIQAGLGNHAAAREHAAHAARLGASDNVWTNFYAADAAALVATWPE
jgi:hypothetical protein